MFKRIFAVMLIVGLMTIGSYAMAEDGQNVPDQLGDIFSGKGQTYGGVEIIKDNLFGPLGIRVWAEAMLGEIDEGIRRDIRGGLMVRIVL